MEAGRGTEGSGGVNKKSGDGRSFLSVCVEYHDAPFYWAQNDGRALEFSFLDVFEEFLYFLLGPSHNNLEGLRIQCNQGMWMSFCTFSICLHIFTYQVPLFVCLLISKPILA